VSDATKQPVAEGKSRKGYTSVQAAPRFPIKLPVEMKSGGSAEAVETENISANGVLFRMDVDVPVGSPVDFKISLPADVVGAAADVQVDCRGRVVRSFDDGGRRGVGVVIDEYRFERR
jgi:PilZ domain